MTVRCVLIDFPGGRAKNAPIVFCCMVAPEGEREADVRGLFFWGGESDVEAEAAADPAAGADADAFFALSKCAEIATSTTEVTLSSSVATVADEEWRPSAPIPKCSSAFCTNCEASCLLIPRRSATWAAAVDANVIGWNSLPPPRRTATWATTDDGARSNADGHVSLVVYASRWLACDRDALPLLPPAAALADAESSGSLYGGVRPATRKPEPSKARRSRASALELTARSN